MISIIIPTYNEADQIANTITKIRAGQGRFEIEIIVTDGGSSDATVRIAQQLDVIVIECERKGRAAQMNIGASAARHDILYFIHADSIPPDNFGSMIITASYQGAKAGCFRLQFDKDHWFLKANAWFTRFNVNAVRFGDQSLFVLKDVFDKSGRFNEGLIMMEDQEIIHRLKRQGKFVVINNFVITSARKYIDNGIYRMQGIFYLIWAMYYLGISQTLMLRIYRRLIMKHKL